MAFRQSQSGEWQTLSVAPVFCSVAKQGLHWGLAADMRGEGTERVTTNLRKSKSDFIYR